MRNNNNINNSRNDNNSIAQKNYTATTKVSEVLEDIKTSIIHLVNNSRSSQNLSPLYKDNLVESAISDFYIALESKVDINQAEESLEGKLKMNNFAYKCKKHIFWNFNVNFNNDYNRLFSSVLNYAEKQINSNNSDNFLTQNNCFTHIGLKVDIGSDSSTIRVYIILSQKIIGIDDIYQVKDGIIIRGSYLIAGISILGVRLFKNFNKIDNIGPNRIVTFNDQSFFLVTLDSKLFSPINLGSRKVMIYVKNQEEMNRADLDEKNINWDNYELGVNQQVDFKNIPNHMKTTIQEVIRNDGKIDNNNTISNNSNSNITTNITSSRPSISSFRNRLVNNGNSVKQDLNKSFIGNNNDNNNVNNNSEPENFLVTKTNKSNMPSFNHVNNSVSNSNNRLSNNNNSILNSPSINTYSSLNAIRNQNRQNNFNTINTIPEADESLMGMGVEDNQKIKNFLSNRLNQAEQNKVIGNMNNSSTYNQISNNNSYSNNNTSNNFTNNLNSLNSFNTPGYSNNNLNNNTNNYSQNQNQTSINNFGNNNANTMLNSAIKSNYMSNSTNTNINNPFHQNNNNLNNNFTNNNNINGNSNLNNAFLGTSTLHNYTNNNNNNHDWLLNTFTPDVKKSISHFGTAFHNNNNNINSNFSNLNTFNNNQNPNNNLNSFNTISNTNGFNNFNYNNSNSHFQVTNIPNDYRQSQLSSNLHNFNLNSILNNENYGSYSYQSIPYSKHLILNQNQNNNLKQNKNFVITIDTRNPISVTLTGQSNKEFYDLLTKNTLINYRNNNYGNLINDGLSLINNSTKYQMLDDIIGLKPNNIDIFLNNTNKYDSPQRKNNNNKLHVDKNNAKYITNYIESTNEKLLRRAGLLNNSNIKFQVKNDMLQNEGEKQIEKKDNENYKFYHSNLYHIDKYIFEPSNPVKSSSEVNNLKASSISSIDQEKNNNNIKILNMIKQKCLTKEDLTNNHVPAYEELFNNNSCCDIIICIGQVEILAHKIILLTKSNYFKNMIISNEEKQKNSYSNFAKRGGEITKIVLIDKISIDIFYIILYWFYFNTINLKVNSSNIHQMHNKTNKNKNSEEDNKTIPIFSDNELKILRELLHLSDLLQIISLQKILIVNYIIPSISKEYALKFLKSSYMKQTLQEVTEVWSVLEEFSLNCVAKNSNELIKTHRNEFLGMEVKLLFKVIEKSCLYLVEETHLSNLIKLLVEVHYASDIIDLLIKLSKHYSNCKNFNTQNIDIKTLIANLDPTKPHQLRMIDDTYVCELRSNEINIKNNNKIDSNKEGNDDKENDKSIFNIINNKNEANNNNKKNIQDPKAINTNNTNVANNNPLNNNLILANSKIEINSSIINKNYSPISNTTSANIRKNKLPTFSFSFSISNDNESKNINNSISIISQCFNSDSRSWNMKIDITEEGDISFFLVEHGDVYIIDKSLELNSNYKEKFMIKFTSVLFDFEIKDISFDKKCVIFYSFPNDHNAIIGVKNFFNIKQLENKRNLLFNIWIKEVPLHSACLQHITDNFQAMYETKIKDDMKKCTNESTSNLNNSSNIIATKHKTIYDILPWDLSYILSSDDLNVESENIVFSALYRIYFNKNLIDLDIVINNLRIRYVDFKLLCTAGRDHSVLRNCKTFTNMFSEEVRRKMSFVSELDNLSTNNYDKSNKANNNSLISNNNTYFTNISVKDEKMKFSFRNEVKRKHYNEKSVSSRAENIASELIEFILKTNHHNGYVSTIEELEKLRTSEKEEYERREKLWQQQKMKYQMEIDQLREKDGKIIFFNNVCIFFLIYDSRKKKKNLPPITTGIKV